MSALQPGKGNKRLPGREGYGRNQDMPTRGADTSRESRDSRPSDRKDRPLSQHHDPAGSSVTIVPLRSSRLIGRIPKIPFGNFEAISSWMKLRGHQVNQVTLQKLHNDAIEHQREGNTSASKICLHNALLLGIFLRGDKGHLSRLADEDQETTRQFTTDLENLVEETKQRAQISAPVPPKGQTRRSAMDEPDGAVNPRARMQSSPQDDTLTRGVVPPTQETRSEQTYQTTATPHLSEDESEVVPRIEANRWKRHNPPSNPPPEPQPNPKPTPRAPIPTKPNPKPTPRAPDPTKPTKPGHSLAPNVQSGHSTDGQTSSGFRR